RKICFSHSVHPFLDNTILSYIILKIYSRNLIYSILVILIHALISCMGNQKAVAGDRDRRFGIS
ncbi:hypothetical protein, partial [Mediterraneibacter gnavus]|uniref:hypothetical protein n=1 Tax=Mediterraneibacter gnavus TaxID=33038 RepID=UPI001A9BB56E